MKTLAAAEPDPGRLITLPNKTWGGKDVLGIEITENVTANDGKPAFANLGVHHAREWPAGEHAMEWAYELINGYKSGDGARDEHRPQQPQHRRADRQPRRLRGLAQRARRARRRRGRGRRRHRLHRRPPGRVPAQELPRRRHRDRVLPDLRRPGRERRRPEPQLRPVLGRPRLGHEPGDADLPRPGAVLRARVAQRPVARLPQPGDVADHQPHDGRPRAARARPGRDRRPGRREPRLQGARRRDGQAQRLLQPEGLRALRHDRARPRTGATTPPAATASRSRSTAAPRTT